MIIKKGKINFLTFILDNFRFKSVKPLRTSLKSKIAIQVAYRTHLHRLYRPGCVGIKQALRRKVVEIQGLTTQSKSSIISPLLMLRANFADSRLILQVIGLLAIPS